MSATRKCLLKSCPADIGNIALKATGIKLRYLHNTTTYNILYLLRLNSGKHARLWETLGSYNLDLLYFARMKYSADVLSRQANYMLRAVLQHGADKTTFGNYNNFGQYMNTNTQLEMYAQYIFWHCLAAAILQYKIFAEVPLNTIKVIIQKSQHSNSRAEKVCFALRSLGL